MERRPNRYNDPVVLQHADRRRRAERLIDNHLYREQLGQVMTHDILAPLRAEAVEHLMALPASVAARLCHAARLWVLPGASPLAQSHVLLALLQHRDDFEHHHGPDPEPLIAHLRVVLRAQCSAPRPKSPLADFNLPINAAAPLGAPPYPYEKFIRHLLVARIDPPQRYWPRFCAQDLQNFGVLFAEAQPQLMALLHDKLEDLWHHTASHWMAINLAVASLTELLAGALGQNPSNSSTLAVERLLGWRISHSLPPDDGAVCMRLLTLCSPSDAQNIWMQAEVLSHHLPHCLRADLIDCISGVPNKHLNTLTHAACELLPSWMPQQFACEWLRRLHQDIAVLQQPLFDLFGRYLAPELPLQQRRLLLEAALRWQHKHSHRLQEAEQFVAHHVRERVLAAEVLYALTLSPQDHPYLRPALKLILRSAMSIEQQLQAIAVLSQQPGHEHMNTAYVLIAQAVVGSRVEDLESSMQEGRLNNSDAVIGQVVALMPCSNTWQTTLRHIVGYIEACKRDASANPLLLSSSRTRTSELNNALYTLAGPWREGDRTDALMANPSYAMRASKKAVGLGYLAASLWQLLHDRPVAGASSHDRERARTDFILALARSVEESGFRVCGWGLSERLVEACAGNIDGLALPQAIYPEPLVLSAARELSRSCERHSRAGQEAFFHRMGAHARAVLHSPEAIALFDAQWLGVMRLDYDWPHLNGH